MPQHRPTLRQVARASGVSLGLASMALNNRPGVASATRERIVKLAREMGYTAHPVARALRTGDSDVIAIIIRNMANPYFLDIIHAIESRANRANKTVMALDSLYSTRRETEHIHRLTNHKINSLAISPTGTGTAIKAWLHEHPGSRVVAINASGTDLEDVVNVGPNDRTAVTDAVEHLTSLNHTRIALFCAPRTLLADKARVVAFNQIAKQLRLESMVVETMLDPKSVRNAAKELLLSTHPPSAFIMNSDYTAHSVYAAAREVGATVGQDISVVGHDDLMTSELLAPSLTTIRINRSRIGIEAAKRLLDPTITKEYLEPTHLIARHSTAPLQ